MAVATCTKCGAAMAPLRIAFSSPWRVECGHCHQRHYYRLGFIPWMLFMALLIPGLIFTVVVASSLTAPSPKAPPSSLDWLDISINLVLMTSVGMLLGELYGRLVRRYFLLRQWRP